MSDLPLENQPRARQVSGCFYSNCLIQAIWHKVLRPLKTKIIFIPQKINESNCPHFFWCDDTGDYDFTPVNPSPTLNIVLFYGYIQKRGSGFAIRYKARRIRETRKKKNEQREAD